MNEVPEKEIGDGLDQLAKYAKQRQKIEQAMKQITIELHNAGVHLKRLAEITKDSEYKISKLVKNADDNEPDL